MTKKRRYGTGTIFKRPNGHWTAQIMSEGQRLSHTCRTKQECQEWLSKTNLFIDHGMSLTYLKITMGEYMHKWLTSIKTTRSCSTWQHYEQLTRSYIVPHLGDLKLQNLSSDHIQNFYNKLFDEGVGIYAIRKVHIIIHGAMKQAVRTGTLDHNPASFARPPKEPPSEMKILNISQVNQFLVAAQGHRWEALYYLAVISGMRQMELLGLKWTDLDWDRHSLKIERQLLRPDGSGVKFSSPKTRYGRRTIILGKKALEILRKHNIAQQAERRSVGDSWQETGLIFTTSNGTPIHPRNLLRDFKLLLLRSGLPSMRFHDLRHTAASLLLNQGIPVIAVSRRLGHAKASITLDVYGHLIPSLQDAIADMIDDLVLPGQDQ